MSSDLQNKLSRLEATPPTGVWDKIADVLDAEQAFSKRLYDYQETPQTDVWKKIESLLEAPVPAKVVPFTTSYRRPIQYISAAGIIAAILVSAALLMKKTDAGTVSTAKEKVIPPANDVAADNPATTPAINSNIQTETASNQNKTQAAFYQTGSKQKRVLNFIKPQNILSVIVLRGRFAPGRVDKEEMFNFSSLNDHMVYSDGDGNAMKLPKKLFSLVNCPDGDGSCKERIHQLQQKLSSTATTADFTGILDMLRQLQ